LLYFEGCKHIFLEDVIQVSMKKISTIIFDLGGVILDLDQDRTLRAFSRLGLDLDDVNESSAIFTDFETGKINADDFRQGIQTLSKGMLTPDQIDTCWNLMLLEITEERFRLIEQLRKSFNIYLLSNTNSIHIDYFRQYIDSSFGLDRWDNLFDKQYLSYEIGLRKPHKAIYEYVLKELGRGPDECIFIDDNVTNVRNAGSLGIHTIHATHPLDLKMIDDIYQTVKTWQEKNK
jgi:HAD superfamily hydrolase (TIGR01509 family)